MTDRYAALFARLGAECAFIPFFMLGDPSPKACLELIDTAVAAGADALELGISFSDPVADGPTIQRAHLRARETDLPAAFDLVAEIRNRHPQLPLGMLVHANVACALGLDEFYRAMAQAGADSVLLPDVPIRESAPFTAAAAAAGVAPVYIAAPNASAVTLQQVAHDSQGYVYALSRAGVTGTQVAAQAAEATEMLASLRRYGSQPPVLGFGISAPEHVRAARKAGARGVIVGSAFSALIERHYPLGGSPPATTPPELLAAVRGLAVSLKAETR